MTVTGQMPFQAAAPFTARSTLRHVRRALALTAAYLAGTLVMMQAMVNLGALGSAVFPGDARLIVWTLAWDNHAVLDRVPLFDANVFHPAESSLQYNEHLIGLSLFSLPVYATTRNPVLAYNVVWILSFVLNALAMHLLAFRHTRSHLAAATAALVFTFSFYKMLHAHGHLAHIWTWLMPLSLWLLERWIERPHVIRAAAWASAVVLQSLGSWYTAVMIVLINAIAIAWWHGFAVRGRWRARLAQLTLVVAASAAIVVPFALPYRTLEPPELAQVFSLSVDWRSYFVPPADTLVGRWLLANGSLAPGSIWGERTVFLGWIASAMAVAGAGALAVGRKWIHAGIALSCVVFGLLLSFGPSGSGQVEQSSVFGLFASIPGLSGFRVPARFALVALFGVSLLTAEAGRALVARFGRAGAVVVVAIWPFMLAEWFVVSMPSGRPQPAEIPAIYLTEELRAARALVSLPAYRATRQWWVGADYLYYSTAHWRPIVNGFGRSEPPDHAHVMSYVNAFPGPNNARKMRELGVDYIVLHGAAYAEGVDDVLRVVKEEADYELVRQIGTDYLIRVRRR
jgi:hypothetical protein